MINWGVLGNAWIARDFMIPALLNSRNGVLAAVASRTEPPKELAPEARHYSSYEALLSDPRIDAVYVPVPNALHAKWSIEAMRSGKHVLCEKPLVCTEEEAREIIRVSKETGRLCMEAFMYRLGARFSLLRSVLATEDMGRILAMQAINGYLLDWASPVREDRELGGGCLYDIGCYCVDSMNLLMAQQGASFEDGEAVFLMKGGADHQCAAGMRYSDGTLASFLCWFNAPAKQSLALVCENGILSVDDPYEPGGGQVKLQRSDGSEKIFETGEGTDPYRLEAEAFADMVTEACAVKAGDTAGQVTEGNTVKAGDTGDRVTGDKTQADKTQAVRNVMISLEESLVNAKVMDCLLKSRV